MGTRLIRPLQWLHTLPLKKGAPLRIGLFLLIVFFTFYPNPRLLWLTYDRYQHLDTLTDPQQPALNLWLTELNAQWKPDATPKQQLKTVQQFVYENIPYEYDWNTYGCADHIPTLSELARTKKDDCDGRAVLGAALLRAKGFQAKLVNDMQHVWVWMPQGEILGPGRGKRTVIALPDPKNPKRKIYRVSNQLPFSAVVRATSMGISVFPISRELVWLLAFITLAFSPSRWKQAMPGALLLITGWIAVWHSEGLARHSTQMWLGWIGIIAGLLWMFNAFSWGRQRLTRRPLPPETKPLTPASKKA